MINIKSFAKAKKDSNSNGTGFAGNNVTVINNGTADSSIPGVYLWGNYHDHTNDVNGSMQVDGSINASGTVTANRIVAQTGNISNLTSTTIETQGITTDELEAIRAIITELIAEDITVDNLTVTKAAHFFKLIIDEVKASMGQIILTPANAVIAKVEQFNGTDFKCYFKATDEDKQILQCFEEYDQLVCQTFNVADGVSYDISNKYYWRLVTNVSQSVETVRIDGYDYPCHWFVLSDSDKDTYSNAVPEPGDTVVLLGNRNDTTRQAAISIGAYNNPFLDSGIKAPFIIQYDGINNYNLSSHRKNVISRQLNYLTASNVTGNNMLNTSKWTNADLTPCDYDIEYFNYSTTATEVSGHFYYDAFSPIIYIEPGDYTFSFYTEFQPDVAIRFSANEETNPLNMLTFITPTATGTLPDDTYGDNPRKYVTFNISSAGYICITVGLQDYAETDLFAKPQLEWGKEVTAFDESAAYTQSQIIMTKDEILLGVGNTGIDIINGKITLDSSNTIINGNLKINSADSGFELYDSSTKVIQIDNDSIGAFDYQLLEIDYLELVVNSAAETISGMAILGDDGTSVKQLQANTYVDFTELFAMSTEPNNATVKLRLFKNTRSTPTVTNYPYGDSLNQDWELVQTITKQQTTSNNYIDFLDSDGMYRLKIEETAYYCFTFSVQLNSFTNTQYYSLAGKYYINQTDYTHIASDGVQLSSTNNSNLIMNDEAFKMRFKDNEITVGYDQALGNDYIKLKNKDTEFTVYNNRITATVGNHILEFNENEILENTYPIDAITAREETSNTVVVNKNDEFIVINNNVTTSLNVNNSDAKYSGHKFIVKHLNGNAVNVIGSVIDYDSDTIITNKSWNDKIPRQFVYLNGAWYIMKLG